MAPKSKKKLGWTIGIACGVVLLLCGTFGCVYTESQYQDLSSGQLEQRVSSFGITIRKERFETPISKLYVQYAGPLPEVGDWQVVGGRSWYNMFGENIGGSLIKNGIPNELEDALYRWFEYHTYPDGTWINKHGMTDAAKAELIVRALETSKRTQALMREGGPGVSFHWNSYLNRTQEATQWIDHVIDVEDLPTVEEVLDDELWQEKWVPRCEEMLDAWKAARHAEGSQGLSAQDQS